MSKPRMRGRRPLVAMSPGKNPLLRLWVLRMLVPLGGWNEFVGSGGVHPQSVADAVGLDELPEEFKASVVVEQLRRLLAEAEVEPPVQPGFPGSLEANLRRMQQLIGLTDIDVQVLGFAILLHSESVLDDAGDLLKSLSVSKVVGVLATCMKLPEADVRMALRPDGLLAQTGLVDVSKTGVTTLRSKVDVLSDKFVDRMLSTVDDPVLLLQDTVAPVSAAHLSFDDYGHAKAALDVARPFLCRAVSTQRRGTNVFVYGDPGTGKSQLARLLASEADTTLFEVASSDSDGDPMSGEARLRSYRAAQHFFAHRAAMLLFDETEDVFNDGDMFFGRKSTAQLRKAWMNRMLEENPVPTVWLSNQVRCMDPAFLRRFDVVIQLKVPSLRQRERIAMAACGDLVAPPALQRIAEKESLAPAVTMRAAEVVRSIVDLLPAGGASSAVVQLIESTLIAQRHGPLPPAGVDAVGDYNPDYVNADGDLASVADGICNAPAARVCLYGPPGTGKTAFGRWLAKRLDRPLHVRNASDILGVYVGETEANIASAFATAEADRAVLLFDEVDSFLRDRRQAQRSWEVTAVNEMLTQMECFSGVFIASTNLLDSIDPGALRRFDLKMKFDYMRAEQAWSMFFNQCEQLALGVPNPSIRMGLARISVLTPGDFAAVARRHRFRPLRDTSDFLDALRAECAFKEDGRKRAIGFV